MSDSTPILMTLPDTCAYAVPTASAPAVASAIRLRFIAFIDTPSLKRLSHAQVLVQLCHMAIELGVRDPVDDPAVLHHVVAIRDGRGEAEILLDQQDREALLLQRADRAPDLLHDHRGEPFRRLVEQQQARAGAQ